MKVIEIILDLGRKDHGIGTLSCVIFTDLCDLEEKHGQTSANKI